MLFGRWETPPPAQRRRGRRPRCSSGSRADRLDRPWSSAAASTARGSRGMRPCADLSVAASSSATISPSGAPRAGRRASCNGGVRYLEHGFFHLVFESSRESGASSSRSRRTSCSRCSSPGRVCKGARIPDAGSLNGGSLAVRSARRVSGTSRRHHVAERQRSSVLATEPKLQARRAPGEARSICDASTNDAAPDD